jgi:hypothetical protein
MRMRKTDDWDDDWDDDVVEKKPPRPDVLTTRTILWGLVVAAIAAVVVGSLLSSDSFDFQEAPSRLVGMWTCADPERSDLWVEFRGDFVIFGTGGTGTMKYRIEGGNMEKVGEIERYKVFFRDLAGKEHNREILLAPPGTSLRFADDPKTSWKRFEQ